MTVLLMGHFDEPHLASVLEACTTRQLMVETIEFGHPSPYYSVVWTNRTGSSCPELNSVCPDQIEDLQTVFNFLPFRLDGPPLISLVPPPNWTDGESLFATREWQSVIGSTLWMWEHESEVPWVTSLRAAGLQDRKPALLHLAGKHYGIPIPDYVIGTDHDSESALLADHELVAKAINANEQIDAGSYFNTSPVTADLLEQASSEVKVPSFLQQRMPAQAEYRVYTVLGQTLAIRIQRHDSQTPIDIRLADRRSLSASIGRIDEGLEGKLVALTHSLGLSYCAFDVLETKDEFYVLDINPAGTWYYLEEWFGLEISVWILATLLEHG